MPGSLQDYLQRYDAPDEINSMGSDFTIIKQGICCYLALRKESNCVTGIDIQQPNPVMDRHTQCRSIKSKTLEMWVSIISQPTRPI